jgi:CubicO group peptidase (beta-lactamase class C family)
VSWPNRPHASPHGDGRDPTIAPRHAEHSARRARRAPRPSVSRTPMMSHTLLPSTARRARLVRRGHAAARALLLAPTLATLAMLAAACSDVTSAPRVADPSRATATTGEIFNLPAGLTEADVRAHVIAPRHVADARLEDNDPAREISLPAFAAPSLDRVAAPGTTVANVPTVDLGAMGLYIHKALKDSVTGYMLEVRQNGVLVHVGQWNWAQTPANAGTGWSENTRMHVASVSKFLTAVALVKALDAKGISYDAKMVDYLPSYWAKGSNVGQISFRNLLQHSSGFKGYGSASDYLTMKSAVAAGVLAADVGNSNNYQNLNYGLMRILIPIITGSISKYTVYSYFPPSNDLSWDAATVSQYKSYMQANVFTPAGVSGPGFSPVYDGKNALAYKAAYALNHEAGWNSGDLSSVAGGAGWRITVKQLLSVMHHVRRMNTIISASKAQYMLDNYFGIDQRISTAAGLLYNKNGAWSQNGKMEQSVAYFLPNGMELALFVDSPIGTTGFSLRGLVKDAYVASLTY